MLCILESTTLSISWNVFCKVSKISHVHKSKCKPNMTFDLTILLIFSQICIDTNLEFDIIKKATKCATMFRLHAITNYVYLSKHYT